MIQPLPVIAASPTPAPTHLLRVFVPGNPVSSNHMYGVRGYAAAKRLTPEAKQWRDDVANSTLAWRFAADAPRPALSVACSFVGARADVDNLLKLTLDGLKLGLQVDDRYVVRVCAEKVPLPARGPNGGRGERGAWIEVMCLPQLPKKAQQVQPRARKPRNKDITKGVTGISDGRSTAGK